MSNHPGLIEIFAGSRSKDFHALNAGFLKQEEVRAMAKLPKARKSKGNATPTHAHNQTSLAPRLCTAQPQPDKRTPLRISPEVSNGSATRPCVIVTRCSCGHLDRDNLQASVKPIVDALRYAGHIAGDTERHIDLYVFQKKVKRKEAGTLIEIVQPCE